MKNQPVAYISADLLKILIIREFPNHVNLVKNKLKKIKSESDVRKRRISAAILKLSSQNLEEMDLLIKKANQDYRDILTWAEYPRASEKGFVINKSNELNSIYAEDWKEYCSWLGIAE